MRYVTELANKHFHKQWQVCPIRILVMNHPVMHPVQQPAREALKRDWRLSGLHRWFFFSPSQLGPWWTTGAFVGPLLLCQPRPTTLDSSSLGSLELELELELELRISTILSHLSSIPHPYLGISEIGMCSSIDERNPYFTDLLGSIFSLLVGDKIMVDLSQ